MKMITALLSLSAVLFSGADAIAVIKQGACPKVTGQKVLDTKAYLGKWYEYQRFPAIFEAGLQCTSAEYTPAANNTINVVNKGLLRVTVFGKTYIVKRSVVRGTATVPDRTKPAELSVSFFGPPSKKANYYIQETDYTDYAVVFSCFELSPLNLNVQFAWILTRKRGVAPSNIDDIYKKLTAAGVDPNDFFTVNNKDCPSEFN